MLWITKGNIRNSELVDERQDRPQEINLSKEKGKEKLEFLKRVGGNEKNHRKLTKTDLKFHQS